MKKKELIFDQYKAVFDLDNVETVDGYIAFLVKIKAETGLYKVFTGILDEDLNFVVPLRMEYVSEECIDNEDYQNHAILYPNKRCFYIDKEGCYLVDLTDVKFDKKDDLYVPNKYILRSTGIFDIGNGKVIVVNNTKKGKDYIYDVVNNCESSNTYDVIMPNSDDENMYDAYLYFKDKDGFDIQVKLLIDDSYDIDEEVEVNGRLNTYYPYYMLIDNDELKNEIQNSYDCLCNILKEDDKRLCKRIKH